jgi:hypothetical protein
MLILEECVTRRPQPRREKDEQVVLVKCELPSEQGQREGTTDDRKSRPRDSLDKYRTTNNGWNPHRVGDHFYWMGESGIASCVKREAGEAGEAGGCGCPRNCRCESLYRWQMSFLDMFGQEPVDAFLKSPRSI